MKAPRELRLAKDEVLEVVRPIYGMPESPIHSFETYSDRHTTYLKIIQSRLEPCAIIRKNEGKLEETIGIQKNDTICAGTESFLA